MSKHFARSGTAEFRKTIKRPKIVVSPAPEAPLQLPMEVVQLQETLIDPDIIAGSEPMPELLPLEETKKSKKRKHKK